MSLTTPFRGAVTVLEVVTPNPLVSKRRKEGLFQHFQHCSGQVMGPWKSVDFYKAQEIAGFFFTDKGISLLLALFTSLNGTDGERSRYRDGFVFKMSGLESVQETKSK